MFLLLIINIQNKNVIYLTILDQVNADLQAIVVPKITRILQIGDRTISIYNLHSFKYPTKHIFDKIQNPLWYSRVFHIHMYKAAKSQDILLHNG